MVGKIVGALAPLILLGSAVFTAAVATEVRVGVLAYRGAERAAAEWDASIRHLNATMTGYEFVAAPYDLGGLRQAVAAGDVDFIITNPGHYVELEAAFHVARIATLETVGGPPPGAAIASAVVVLADSPLKDFSDLKGRRVAAVAAEAFGGFRLAWREMAAHDINPFHDLQDLSFTGFPIERVTRAVADGSADAGIVRACLLEQMVAEGQARPGQFRVLGGRLSPDLDCEVSTALYPDWPFARLPAIPAALAKQVGMALLAMPASSGQAWTVPVDYQEVHELFRALKIGPYDYLGRRSLAELARAYWPWLLAVVLAAAWWVVHVVRVEHLVRLRTDELRAAGERARRQREELEHGARLALLGEMVSSLAHEINQPLAAIHNYAGGCERRLAAGIDAEGVREGVRLIAGQAERAAGIVKRIRAFVRKRTPEQRPMPINDSVIETLNLFAAIAASRGVVVERRLGESLPLVQADRIQIEQVILNLLQNAADAMAAVTVQRKLSIITEMVGGMVQVVVSDTGIGLSEEARLHLFEPFFTTKPEGLGLGLSLSRSIIEAHGGRLWAETAPGGGACFKFSLPAITEVLS
ncbi:MAG: PhnD/SsuA/transferrin family substrate-binding protein [Rhodospirillales bacterium]|jgi:two-component system sensor histidine kinase TtrS